MDTKTFEKILQARINKIQSVLKTKAEEYAVGGDRVYNFKAGAAMCESTPAQVCCYYMTKHLTCVRDMAFGRLEATPELIDEKIGDAINYLILLEAILRESLEENNKGV